MKTTKTIKALIIICILSMQSGVAQVPVFEWAKQMGGADNGFGSSIAVDDSGNVYTTGTFSETLDFDPGAGTMNLTSAGIQDIFVQKLDFNGNFQWAKRMGGISFDGGTSIAVDPSGNVYTTGSFRETVDFDPGLGESILTSAGSGDIFVQKLDSDGSFLWVKQMGGGSNDQSHSIAVDYSGSVYFTGSFRATADFDPGVGIANLISDGDRDIFVEKLDANGNFIWAKRMGASAIDFGESIAVDATGFVYISGSFGESVDFDPGAGTVILTSAGSLDIFIQKLDTDGNLLWAKHSGGAGGDCAQAIAVDTLGNVYSTGSFLETADFDPGVGAFILTSVGGQDIFIQKLDANGNFLWAKRMGGIDDFDVGGDNGKSIAVDASGNVYTTGEFIGTADFDPGIEIANLTSPGFFDVFVQKLDSYGNFLWARQIGVDNHAYCNSIVVDASNNLYTTGSFKGIVDFDFGAGNTELTSDEHDIFVQKLSQCYPTTLVPDMASLPDVLSQCSVTLFAPTANDGCGGTFTGITTTVFPITTLGTTSITWIYVDESDSISAQMQDVVITSDVTAPVPSEDNLSDLPAICEITSKDAPAPTATDNCEGTITASPDLAFPITDQSITEIVWTYDDGNGNVVTQTQAINWIEMDVTTSLDGLTITANNTDGTYQWIDCDNDNTPIAGENDQSYTATINGNYAVEITENGCVATSECVSIVVVGLSEFEQNLKVVVYPNPSSDIFNIEFEKEIENVVLTITDIEGKLISTKEIQNSAKASIQLNESPGIYLLTIKLKEGQKTIQLVKD